MVESKVSLPEKWGQYLKSLAEAHQIELNAVINELCDWSFSNSESKKQFEAWLDDAYPPKGDAEDKENDTNEKVSENEEETEEESEEEGHNHRD